MIIKLNIDAKGYNTKPSKFAGAISNRTRQQGAQKEIEAEQLLNYITGGFTFTPALIGGSLEEHEARRAKGDRNLQPYWQSQQVIVADIDNEQGHNKIKYELTPGAALDACKAAGIDPFCIYKTFSYTPEHEKYRVLIVLDRPITEFDTAADLIGRFCNLFNAAIAETYKTIGIDPEICADSSIEPVKLIFGGRTDCIIYRSENITPIDKLRALPKAPTIPPVIKSRVNNAPKYAGAAAQSERDLIISALYAIDPADLDYTTWLKIGGALKDAGIEYSIFDQWSAQDYARYNEEKNYKMWQGLKGASNPATAGTIFYHAKQYNWSFPPKGEHFTAEEWSELMRSFDDAKPAQEIQAADFPPDFFTDPAPEDPNNMKSIEDNMPTQPKTENKITPLQFMSAGEYISGQYDADIQELKQYAGRKMGLHPDIDKYLTLYPGLAVLGGQASLGKTTFCVNMAAQLLERGEHILYFALEQRPDEIITKAVTSYICKNNPAGNTTNIMLNNGLRNEEITEALFELQDKLKNLYVIECDFETTAAGIIATIEQYIKTSGVKPIVIVDYLQLIAPPADLHGDIRACVDENLKALKKMQKDNKLFVLVVSSFNRASNYEPISYESFKETGMIESTCDYVFGLQLTIQDADNSNFYLTLGTNGMKERPPHDKKNLIQQEQIKTPKKVEFVSLKNRRGKQFFTACFDYFPCYDFYEVDSIGLDAFIEHRTPKAGNKAPR